MRHIQRLGHEKEPSSSLLYKSKNPLPSHKRPLIRSPRPPQETYELATDSANTACVKTMRSEVAFAEVPLPAMNPATPSENGFRPDITIQTGSVLIGVSNTASDALTKRH